MTENRHSSSFRDPSGFIFKDNGTIKRVIFPIYFEVYDKLTSSGFFKPLHNKRLLIDHREIERTNEKILIQPEQIPFVTYPYEWSFEQYKEAALLTLKLQKYAITKGFSLKDASAFNVTFHRGQAVFIDTLSFDFYQEGSPWRGYKQFITHFFGPLLLSKYYGTDMLRLMAKYIDGIPIKTISSLLPSKTKLNPLLYSNIHLLAKYEAKHNDDYEGKTSSGKLSKKGQIKIIESLYDYIKSLKLNESTEWSDYYCKLNYSDEALISKTKIINTWVDEILPKRLIDLGGNTGVFTRSLNTKLEQILVCDIDSNAIDENYSEIKASDNENSIAFVMDLVNPSPAIGFANKERTSFIERLKDFSPDISMALALIHHLTLSANVPFSMSSEFFSSFSEHLIIEFPKREDSWVKRLLNTKQEFKSHFDFYNIGNFENYYSKVFDILEKKSIKNSERVMYLLKRK